MNILPSAQETRQKSLMSKCKFYIVALMFSIRSFSFRAKLGVGLLSGKYSQPPPKGSPPDADAPGISPLMFKTLVGRGHPDFSTKKQQDAQEFFLHVLNLVERNSRNKNNPGECFKFQVEERVQCSTSEKVKYTHRADTVLALNIPLEAATNKEEVYHHIFFRAVLNAS